MATQSLKVHYKGSLFWLIFWLIIFFPVALVLFFTGAEFKKNETSYSFHYNGSRFWLCFWVIVFFPIAFLLLFLNGMTIRNCP